MPLDPAKSTRDSSVFLLVRILFVGGSTALIYMGLTFVIVEVLGARPTIASSISYVSATCYNYLLHYHWTFASDAPHGVVLVRYFLVCLGGLLLNGLIMHFGQMLGDAHYMIVQLFSTFAVICWNLFLGIFWVYK